MYKHTYIWKGEDFSDSLFISSQFNGYATQSIPLYDKHKPQI